MNEINNEKLNSGIKEIRNIKMTLEEKENILHSILSSPIQKREPIKSPWMNFSFLSNRLSYMAIAICLVLIISGGTFYGSQKNKTGNISSLARIDTQKQNNFQNPPSQTANLKNNNVIENTNIANPTKNPTLAILDGTTAVNNNKIGSATSAPVSSNIRTSGAGGEYGLMHTNPDSSITIISPNGGEVFKRGDKIKIKWQTNNVDASFGVWFHLDTVEGEHLNNGDLVTSWTDVLNTGETTLSIPNDIPAGQYKLSLTIAMEIEDISDNYFKVE